MKDHVEQRPKIAKHVEPRDKQRTPAELVTELMQNIRNQFYNDAELILGAKKCRGLDAEALKGLLIHAWERDKNYILREVVLWPAAWMNERGVTMPLDKFGKLFLDKLQDMKQHCAQESFEYFPAYLRYCIQSHFKTREDSIYEEAKSLRAPLAAVLGRMPTAPTVQTIEPLAASHAVLVSQQRRKKRPAKVAEEQVQLL